MEQMLPVVGDVHVAANPTEYTGNHGFGIGLGIYANLQTFAL